MLSGHWEKSWILTEELKDVMVRQQNGREREMQGDGRTVAETATALEATRSNVAAAENKVSSVKGECKALWEHRGKGQREQRTGRNIPDLQRVDKKERCNVDQWQSWQGAREQGCFWTQERSRYARAWIHDKINSTWKQLGDFLEFRLTELLTYTSPSRVLLVMGTWALGGQGSVHSRYSIHICQF